MFSSTSERPSGRRRFRVMAAVFTAAVFATGLSAVDCWSRPRRRRRPPPSRSRSATSMKLGPPARQLSVEHARSTSSTPSTPPVRTSTAVYSRVCTLEGCTGDIASPTDVIGFVHQCNDSNNGGGSTTVCSVNIVNNISRIRRRLRVSDHGEPVQRLRGRRRGRFTACIPSSQGSPTVTQCDGSGNGGGAAAGLHRIGTTSSDFPITIEPVQRLRERRRQHRDLHGHDDHQYRRYGHCRSPGHAAHRHARWRYSWHRHPRHRHPRHRHSRHRYARDRHSRHPAPPRSRPSSKSRPTTPDETTHHAPTTSRLDLRVEP